MQSNGNAIGTALAREEPVRTILSGPAAGVVGAAGAGARDGRESLYHLRHGRDFDRRLALRRQCARSARLAIPDGYAVRTPVIDIHTVGAGGGSIAAIDAGGSLKVGPESAGAKPGPACYGEAICRP